MPTAYRRQLCGEKYSAAHRIDAAINVSDISVTSTAAPKVMFGLNQMNGTNAPIATAAITATAP